MKFSLGPTGRLFVATAVGSFFGWFIVEPVIWTVKQRFDKKKDLPPPKISSTMHTEEGGATKISLKKVLSEWKNPSNAGTRVVKYISLAAVLYVGFVNLRSAFSENRFKQNEAFANKVFEMEANLSRSPP